MDFLCVTQYPVSIAKLGHLFGVNIKSYFSVQCILALVYYLYAELFPIDRYAK
jgi:hypothetical protein